jgi:hypothetical protein
MPRDNIQSFPHLRLFAIADLYAYSEGKLQEAVKGSVITTRPYAVVAASGSRRYLFAFRCQPASAVASKKA